MNLKIKIASGILAATAAGIVATGTARGDVDWQWLVDKVNNQQQELNNHEQRITATENKTPAPSAGSVTGSTTVSTPDTTSGSLGTTSTAATSTSTTSTATATPTPAPTPPPAPTVTVADWTISDVHDYNDSYHDHWQYWCNQSLSDGSTRSVLEGQYAANEPDASRMALINACTNSIGQP